MSDASFLARWSRRKAQARSAPVTEAPPAKAPDVEQGASAAATNITPEVTPQPDVAAGFPASDSSAPTETGTESKPPELTLADVARLTRESDFSPFVKGDVSTEVKNAALKKLFSDPHFNVMDGLDVYIDDYSVPDPLPASMLAKMAQARFLGLVKEAAEDLVADHSSPVNRGTIEGEPASTGAQAANTTPSSDAITADENADLQLQPHDAAGRVDADPGTGENGGGKQ
jgi:hypothetical protein